MKKYYTDISIVLDRSGSMQSIRDDTIGGFNSFLRAQQEVPGEATITLVQFDDLYEVVLNAVPINDAKPLDSTTFVPRGWTALLDAIGRTINATGARLAALDEAQRPEKVIFVIITDGEENYSHEFNEAQIDQLITLQREQYQWEFVFLGANQNAITVARDLGISTANAMSYAANSRGVSVSMDSLSSNMRAYRSGTVKSMSFNPDDYKKQTEAGVDASQNQV